MHDGEELQEQSGEEEDSVEPVVKRPRPEPAYKRRYIRVTKKLPRGGYYFQVGLGLFNCYYPKLQTRPNTAIFFGSYVYYDLEKKRLVNAPERYETPPYALMDKDDSCGGSESTITRRGSEPPEIVSHPIERRLFRIFSSILGIVTRRTIRGPPPVSRPSTWTR